MINKPKNDLSFKILLNTRIHLFYTAAVVLTVLVVLLVGLIPQIQEVISLNSTLAKERPKLDRLNQKLISLDEVQFTPEFAQIDIVNSALPSKKPLLELLTSLQSISAANSIFINNLELSPGEIATESGSFNAGTNSNRTGKKSAGAVDSLTITMDIVGQQEQVREFLNLIEKITPFTTITQLSVELSRRNQGSEELLEASITTESYFFTKSLTATVESALPQLSQKDREVLTTLADFVENDLPEQTEITGGGLEDLFGVDALNFE